MIVDKRLTVEAGQTWTIWGLFDAHADNAMSELKRFHRDIDKIAADPCARVILGGDFNDMMFAKGDPRHCPTQLKPFLLGKNAKADELIPYNVELLSRIADKIDAYLIGNHEQTFADRHETNVAIRTVEELNRGLAAQGNPHRIPYVGYWCWVGHFLEYNPGGKWTKPTVRRIDGFCHHGRGGDSPVTQGMIDITRVMTDFVFDWYMSGHIHKHTASDRPALRRVGSFGNGRIKDVPRQAVICPGYKRNYSEQPSHDFSERQRHSPVPLGAGRVYYDIIGKTADGLDVEVRWN